MVAERRAQILNDVLPKLICVRAQAHSESLPRVLAIFAQRGILPRQLCCRRTNDVVLIDIELDAHDDVPCELILAKLRNLPLVERATLAEQPR